jgi:hypothetical protein
VSETPRQRVQAELIRQSYEILAGVKPDEDSGRIAVVSANFAMGLAEELEAMTARVQLVERQVAVLLHLASKRPCADCPAFSSCDITIAQCYENMAAWSRAEENYEKENEKGIMSETQINWAREIADEKRRDSIRDLERELAAMTAERDALKEVDAIAKNLEWCMRLSKSVKEGETMVQWVKRMMGETARAELDERQVTLLIGTLASEINRYPCGSMSWSAYQWAAWSRAEAGKEGGKG